MKKIRLILICLIILLFINCNDNKKKSENEKIINKDSIELTNLTKSVYEWHLTKFLDDFPYKYDEEQNEIFIGIDWNKYEENIRLFKQTNFFSNNFFKRHKEIAMTIDSSIKRADKSFRNSNDGIPIWETGADNWCNCQDYDDNFWKNLTIDSLTINKNEADFIWRYDKYFSHTYKLTAKKEDGSWKINSLEGFKYFYSFEEYEKIMKVKN